MLETLTKGFTSAREKLSGVRELSEENIDQSLRDVRTSLLEADVDLTVARDFLARVKERALGEKVATRVRDASGKMVRVTPGQHFVKVCEEELIDLMGPVDSALAQTKGVTSLMLVGLQGVGKATSSGLRFCFCKWRASLAAMVVLPTPCRPTSISEVTPFVCESVELTGPIRSINSSSQTLTKC